MYIKKTLVALSLALVLLSPSFAYAQNDYGAGVAAQKAGLKNTAIAKMGTPAAVIGEVINIALSFVGIIFFVLILYAGFTWMTAMGNTESVTKAKNIIETAIIGLVLVGGAYAIANFVFSRLGTGGGGAGGGGAPVTEAECSKAENDGKSCGARRVCNEETCRDMCIVNFVEKDPECSATCVSPKIVTAGLCSDPRAEIKCCHNP